MEKLLLRTASEIERERLDFKRDRYKGTRVKYLAHAKGYVMVRKPRAAPFVMTEKEWRQLPYLGGRP